MSADIGEHVDREMYQKLVGKLIYLGHTHFDISFTISVVSCYMHNPRKGLYGRCISIMRYLKVYQGRA
jgi:hypothetical protein